MEFIVDELLRVLRALVVKNSLALLREIFFVRPLLQLLSASHHVNLANTPAVLND
jgi:hypothetical protein